MIDSHDNKGSPKNQVQADHQLSGEPQPPTKNRVRTVSHPFPTPYPYFSKTGRQERKKVLHDNSSRQNSRR